MTGDKLKATFGVAALALGAALAVSAAHAQPAAYDDTYGPDYAYTAPEVTVMAPRILGRSAIGAPIQRVRESRVVYTDGLDLATPWGAHALRQRIERAAREACSDLDARYPITDQSNDCVGDAVRDAMYRTEYALGYAPPTWPDYG